MSAREWQPGDVAMVQRRRVDNPVVGLRDTHGWAISTVGARGEHAHWVNASEVDVIRPLALIDPEDREQVERLAKAMHESDHIAPWHDLHSETRSQIEDAMQAALREFAKPPAPKPEEPRGLGAVVEAINDNRFVRVGDAGWVHFEDAAAEPCDWRDIAVVRILFHGVTP